MAKSPRCEAHGPVLSWPLATFSPLRQVGSPKTTGHDEPDLGIRVILFVIGLRH